MRENPEGWGWAAPIGTDREGWNYVGFGLWPVLKKGSALKERVHLEVISTPRQMRYALNYVLRNDVHHGLGLGKLDPSESPIGEADSPQNHKGDPTLPSRAPPETIVTQPAS